MVFSFRRHLPSAPQTVCFDLWSAAILLLAGTSLLVITILAALCSSRISVFVRKQGS
jgi:hypothetical protein